MRNICKICSGNTKEIVDYQFKKKYYFCIKCGFLFLDKIHIVSNDKEVERYLLHNCTLDDTGYIKMFEDFIENGVLPFFENDFSQKKILDYGCGPGPDPVLAHMLKKIGFQTDIYDVYFFKNKKFENKLYDMITITEVIEHLKNPLDVLSMLKANLKKNGLIVLTTLFHPIKTGVEAELKTFQNWWYRRDCTHISFFLPKTIRTIASLLEMELIKTDNIKLAVLKCS